MKATRLNYKRTKFKNRNFNMKDFKNIRYIHEAKKDRLYDYLSYVIAFLILFLIALPTTNLFIKSIFFVTIFVTVDLKPAIRKVFRR